MAGVDDKKDIFVTLSDVSSTDEEKECFTSSSLPIAEDTTKLKDSSFVGKSKRLLSEEETQHLEHFPSIQSQSRRSLKRRRKKFGEYEDMMRNPEILRWWKRRFDLFWRFDEGIKMDEESWYTVTPEEVARRQAEVCASDIIIDAFAGAGGNTIQFALKCKFVIGIDNNLERLTNVLQPNIRVYGVQSRIDCICGDVTSVLRAVRSSPISPIDTAFMSPPWGGPGYLGTSRLPPGSSSWNKHRRRQLILEELNKPCPNIFDMDGSIPGLLGAVAAAKSLFLNRPSPRLAVYLPRNSSVGQLLKLGWDGKNLENSENRHEVKIEEYWLRGRRMAVCAYIGDFEIFDEAL
ncbi:hypothetical protein Aperf_G00000105232 [Anoplocephala perfoliata]